MFKYKFLRNILLISAVAVLILPVYTALSIYPSFRKILIANAEDDAVRMASHMVSEILPAENELKKESIPDSFLSVAEKTKRDFGLMKIKLFSPSGEIIYSTVPHEIGKVNTERYFHEIVAKGKNYSKYVQKNTKSLENQTVTVDVVETYIPLIKNNKFLGAFEIYLDITNKKTSIDKLALQSYVILFTITLILLISVVITSFKAKKHIIFHQRAEDALTASEQKFKTLFNTTNDAILILDWEGNILEVNNILCERLGYRRDELLKLTPRDLTTHEYAGKVSERLYEILKKGSAIFETAQVTRDGIVIPTEISSRTIEYEGKPAMLSIARDITERKRAEEMLRESEERFRTIFEEGPLGMAVIALDYGFVKVNEMLSRTLGYTEEELAALKLTDITHSDVISADVLNIQRLVRGKVPYYKVEKRCLRKNGELCWISLTASMIRDETDNPLYFLGMFEDITERKNLESQLRHTQKMEAIGELAGGIAHDFNNLLTAIIGFANLAEMKMGKDNPSIQYMEQILAAADRAAYLTKGLLAFSRKQLINPQLINLNSTVKQMEKLLGRVISEEIELRTSLADQELVVMADASQIDQVLMNLATNARDSMPSGGALCFETGSMEMTNDYTKIHGFGRVGSYAMLAVSDTGAGMDETTSGRIFEPFFTTKEVGKGTGLGLAIVYGIVKQHNGYINAYSEPDKGTTFRIYLPLVGGEPASEHMDVIPHAALEGTETVLVVEDNPDVRTLTRAVLEQFGYQVIEAVDGAEGVAKFTQHKDDIKLVIMDVIMPKMDGKRALVEMRKIRPNMKALFTSGYTADIIHKKGILDEEIDFISKPASPQALLKKIREMLSVKP